jgi:Holliday junction resolvase RusA-like endonuclease
MIKAQAKIMMGFKEPTSDPIELIVAFYFPVFKSWSKAKKISAINGEVTQKPDVSNLVKSVEDALNGVVYVDDCQIVRIVAVKHFVEIGNEGVEIIVNLAEDKKWDQ